jgi:holliday junction DNA helicase RuvA
MIATLSGKIIEKEEKSVILEVHGIGYRVAILGRLKKIIKLGDQLTLRIYHNITGEAEDLYGFKSQEDQHYFELLLTVPSVGPRTAMSILEVAPPATLNQAVSENDTALLTKVSGVGRKTAERILVELKGKIEQRALTTVSGGVQQETISALISIGFTTSQAREAVGTLPRSIKTVEDAVRAALQKQN